IRDKLVTGVQTCALPIYASTARDPITFKPKEVIMTYANTGTPRPPGRAARWQDPANLILAIWLFISPWVLQFGYAGTAAAGTPTIAAWNAWALSVIVFLVALTAMGPRMVSGQKWLNLWLWRLDLRRAVGARLRRPRLRRGLGPLDRRRTGVPG